MFLIEWCKHCAVCDTVTPHSRRWFSFALFTALICLLLAGWMFVLGAAGVVVGCLFAFIALAIFSFDRERMWRIRCERCRGKARREIEKTKPDKHTEVVL